jgi:hypothetical protein
MYSFVPTKQPRSEKFWNCLTKVLHFAAKNSGMANKKYGILFCRATKTFGIYRQKKLKLSVFCCRSGGKFGFCQQKQIRLTAFATAFCSAAQRNFLELRTMYLE